MMHRRKFLTGLAGTVSMGGLSTIGSADSSEQNLNRYHMMVHYEHGFNKYASARNFLNEIQHMTGRDVDTQMEEMLDQNDPPYDMNINGVTVMAHSPEDAVAIGKELSIDGYDAMRVTDVERVD